MDSLLGATWHAHRARKDDGGRLVRPAHRDFTLFGPGVQILTPMHPFDAALRILAGVSIGSRAVIGAGSVVTRDVPGGALAAGNPCRVVREIANT